VTSSRLRFHTLPPRYGHQPKFDPVDHDRSPPLRDLGREHCSFIAVIFAEPRDKEGALAIAQAFKRSLSAVYLAATIRLNLLKTSAHSEQVFGSTSEHPIVGAARGPGERRNLIMRYNSREAFKTTSPEDICHCGRLKRYKNCCAPLPEIERRSRVNSLSLEQRSVLTLDAMQYFFLNGTGDKADVLRNNITEDRVSQFYRYLADLWPPDLDTFTALRSLSDPQRLSGYYVGWVRPETILRSITRISLYSDRLFISQPFHLPWQMRDEYDPVQHPGEAKLDTHRWALAMLLLEPWVRTGMVVLVPDPAAFDDDLRTAFLDAGKRREAEGKITIDSRDHDQIEEIWKGDFIQQFYSLPDEEIIARLSKHGLTKAQIPGILRYVEKQRENPYFVPHVLSEAGGTLETLSIPVIEETILTCGLTRAFPFTNIHGKWRELLDRASDLPEDAQVWSPLTQAFSRLEFDFLDGFDASIAFDIREDGRLESFRRFLRKTWKTIDGTTSVDAADRHARDLSDELTSEYAEARAEWQVIHQRFQSSMRKNAAAAFFGIVTSLFTTGSIGVALSLACSLFTAKGDAGLLRDELAQFRAKVPLSLFIDIAATKSE
jgi:hypothetical protein